MLSDIYTFPGLDASEVNAKIEISIPQQQSLIKFTESHVEIAKADEDDFTVLMSESYGTIIP